jgi:dihydroxyacetone kinase
LEEEIGTIKGEEVAVCEVIRRAAVAAERGMGGTSGAIYAIFLNALASALRQRDQESSWTALAAALKDALSELCRYTLARKGQRTLMDALIPFVEHFQEGDLDRAYQAAKAGAESTRMMAAAMGRASYVGKEVFDREGGIPDPGALGVVSVIRGICEGLQQG